MRAVLQRVTRARVSVAGQTVGEIGPGLLALVGVTHTDTVAEAQWIARKIADLRILREETSVADTGAEVLVVSQFTLYGQARKGRRPSWTDAAPGEVAEPLVDTVVAALRERGVRTETGAFGADMAVELTNDGPVTLVLDRRAGVEGCWC
ncbi:D-aminoacyl-tRNA deacylase [Ruania albidiflava]|uniref:D-aminoacyl-tRNA deacylase n=1 Tax=Ruania albidiflava TaxID=366586 RepID=UPI0004892C78|nr:D-aminoacyl-tRNA deacylase [Ruania albidiflava]